ncbi:glucosamine-6-phosphate deaminase [Facklamia miroungae]|uniref:Glucosamine-6-phosphate deaminase n=1 Tax=Facklamia miroungae TaxID=120956 RepID=A0A1G7S4X7_9LACT|nr:glucosamine-6-phosphate deaminase [Facklamia miroungae]NKZ29178.1 glucosamine-6-phosphate deaminase [Facklamia miroungae]SDG17529.1 glucosamine-6-phosphate deaminase [Facklamia miroungae]
MRVEVYRSSEEASLRALEIFSSSLQEGADVFGMATGSTPERLYELLSQSDIDFSKAVSINLDEYVGLDESNSQSYAYYMKKHLFKDKPFKATYIPNGHTQSIEEELNRYDQIIEENPIDLQLLGLGSNGHIGFNEPGTDLDAPTSLVQLTQSTIQDNQRFFDSKEEIPTQAITMGIGSILKAKKIIVMAFGSQKAQAVKGMIEGPVTSDLPASVLQNHPNVYVLLDKAAASLLKR